ncbi:MAG: hypothetical protein ACOVLD_07780 [Bacteroidia bacterium]
MAIVKKSNFDELKENLVILTTEFKSGKKYGLSDNETEYVKQQIKAEKKSVTVNQLKRLVFVVIVDNKAEQNKRKEKLRKSGCSLAAILNDAKKTSVGIIAETAHVED